MNQPPEIHPENWPASLTQGELFAKLLEAGPFLPAMIADVLAKNADELDAQKFQTVQGAPLARLVGTCIFDFLKWAFGSPGISTKPPDEVRPE